MKTFRFNGKTYRWNVFKMINIALWVGIVAVMAVTILSLWAGTVVASAYLG